MERALYGPNGFYRTEPAAAHFRTSAHLRAFARAVAVLVRGLTGSLDRVDVVDLGAGRGEFLTALTPLLLGADGSRFRLHGVDVLPRPEGLDWRIGWGPDIPELTGLLIANEWLDNVPLDVVQDGRVVLVDSAGAESLGPPVSAEDAAWIEKWWPGADRVEVGRARDEAWSAAVGKVRTGIAVAVDYGHTVQSRPAATLTGYRHGRQVPPVPDGSCDITAHVAVDSLGGALLGQREALHRLGATGRRPPRELAGSDPRAYLQAMTQAGEEGELLDPRGLGGFTWVVHPVGVSAAPLVR